MLKVIDALGLEIPGADKANGKDNKHEDRRNLKARHRTSIARSEISVIVSL